MLTRNEREIGLEALKNYKFIDCTSNELDKSLHFWIDKNTLIKIKWHEGVFNYIVTLIEYKEFTNEI